ncbi:hypothetical protein [Aquamicrobium sp. LC103]|uniref:hypothetical protein n=1 Tax=Aquamicrobium sp. LC103 TaxID=1120658 RepID=UPI00069AF6A5|nr:hypothetical protein [Aquamicrobium sp. LC103]TKT74525.1 hypothetical protein XW59_024120 [Aquamicrobium sp. LC103]
MVEPTRVDEIVPGASFGTSTLHLSLHRLIMIAGANRDFALSHSDNEAARQAGAPAAFADVMLCFTLFERLLLQWSGPRGRVKRLGPFKIRDFVTCGQDSVTTGTIIRVDEVEGPDGEPWLEVEGTVEIRQPDGRTPVAGKATMLVPRN